MLPDKKKCRKYKKYCKTNRKVKMNLRKTPAKIVHKKKDNVSQKLRSESTTTIAKN